MPLQLDTDCSNDPLCSTIVLLRTVNNFEPMYRMSITRKNSVTLSVVRQKRYMQGYVKDEVITWDIGTTATFTRSNPVISALGADIGILLTEFGLDKRGY